MLGEFPLGRMALIPLREVWPGEATHFTPWLAANLNILSEKLGFELALESTETAAGDFSADITATDISTNSLVIIENQYGSTDHRHPGQLLTYSSFLKAQTVVWIAESIRPEHKSAIDFLNQNISPSGSLKFFAFEAKLIKIDDSRPAFILNTISEPPPELLQTPSSSVQQSSETRERYRSFFQSLIDTLRERHHFTGARAGQPQNWYSFSSEISKVFKYGVNFTNDGRAKTEIYIDTGEKQLNSEYFDFLLSEKSEIERQFGKELSWERLDNRRACRIAVYTDGDIDSDSETLSNISTWMIDNLLKMKAVFPKFFTSFKRTNTISAVQSEPLASVSETEF